MSVELQGLIAIIIASFALGAMTVHYYYARKYTFPYISLSKAQKIKEVLRK